MSDDKKIKVVFHPNFFKNFDGTQEELDNLVKEIQDSAGSGNFETRKLSEDEIDELPDHVLRELEAVIDLMTEEGLDMDQLEADYKKKLN